MATCPVCSDVLLRHIRNGKTYWLCRHCRSEILETRSKQTFNLSDIKDKGIAYSSLLSQPEAKSGGNPMPALPIP